MFRTIVAATDGSDHARNALTAAADIAAKYGARLVIVHALLRGAPIDELNTIGDRVGFPDKLRDTLRDLVEAPVAATAMGGGYPVIIVPDDVLKDVGDQVLDDARKTTAKGGMTSVETVISYGDAADAILAHAKKEGADLIVLGTRGLSGLKELFLGSVSHKVNQQAACACMTTK